MPAYTLSKSQGGLGTLLQVNPSASSPPTWVTVGELIDIDDGGMNEFDDSTNTQSAAREVLATIFQPGKKKFTANRIGSDAGQRALETSKQNKTRLQYQIVLPINVADGQTTQGDVIGFYSYVEQFAVQIKTEKKVSISGTLQTSGLPTLAYGS